MAGAEFPGQRLLQWLEPVVRVDEWVPPHYRRYAPLVRDGLAFFLGQLPSHRLEAIVAGQLALGRAEPAQRLAALMLQCPVLHKLAQVLAHDQRLDQKLRRRLARLETLPATLDTRAAGRLVRAELGVGHALRLGAPIAEASVALVIPYRAADGGAVREGVLKVLKPGIEQRLAEDLRHWPALGAFLQDRAEHYGLPLLQYGATLETVASLLRAELRLDREQIHLARAAKLNAQSTNIKVPELYPECTPRVTAMERIRGRPLAQVRAASAEARSLARRLLAGMFVDALIGADASALVHGDPHPGNMLVLDDGRIAMLDWALAVEIDNTVSRLLVRLLLAAMSQDGETLTRCLAELSAETAERGRLRALGDRSLRTLRWGRALDADWVLRLLDAAAVEAGACFPDSLLVLRKSLQMAFGVFSDLAPDARPGLALTQAMISATAAAIGGGRPPATGLDAADWMNFFESATLMPGRFWLGLLGDLGVPHRPQMHSWTEGEA